MKLMTFDVGGTEIKYALMDEQFNIYERGYVPTPMDTFEHFRDAIDGIYRPHADQVEGIAMSLPGFIDTENGKVLGSGALRYNWRRPVGVQLAEYCGCPVILENDGKAAAQAEFSCGSLQGCTNAAVFVIGTGVGGGLIIDKKIVRGIHACAGEFSFINADSGMFDNFDGFVGNACSTTGLLRKYARLKGTDELIDSHGAVFQEIVILGLDLYPLVAGSAAVLLEVIIGSVDPLLLVADHLVRHQLEEVQMLPDLGQAGRKRSVFLREEAAVTDIDEMAADHNAEFVRVVSRSVDLELRVLFDLAVLQREEIKFSVDLMESSGLFAGGCHV
ncbi:MAG: ROK family protein, partial [Erysipelotrichaceae bacterium]|nr:ROK family protein [Erysipelotrichaceae bacterium]